MLQIRLEVNAVYPGSALVSLAEHRNKVVLTIQRCLTMICLRIFLNFYLEHRCLKDPLAECAGAFCTALKALKLFTCLQIIPPPLLLQPSGLAEYFEVWLPHFQTLHRSEAFAIKFCVKGHQNLCTYALESLHCSKLPTLLLS